MAGCRLEARLERAQLLMVTYSAPPHHLCSGTPQPALYSTLLSSLQVDQHDISRHSVSYVGKLRSNFMGTEFVLHNAEKHGGWVGRGGRPGGTQFVLQEAEKGGGRR